MSAQLCKEDLQYICEKFFNILKLNIVCFDECGVIQALYTQHKPNNPLSSREDHIKAFLSGDEKKRSRIPLLKTTVFLENYLFLRVSYGFDQHGYLMIGPCLETVLSDKNVQQLLINLKIPVKYEQQLREYYAKMTIMQNQQFYDTAFLMHYCLFGEKIYQIEVDDQSLNENIPAFFKGNDNAQTSSFMHHSQAYEKHMLDLVRTGRLEELIQFFKLYPVDGYLGTHSPDPLRNIKDLFISYTPIVSHTAVEGGLDWELSLSLSDRYIQAAEACTSVGEILEMFGTMTMDYTKRVQNLNETTKNIGIVKCKNYIIHNIYGKITLPELSKVVNMNASYLSQLFKKEEGITISEYIVKMKIEEAKRLMTAPESSLTDIYLTLGFNDQSHFCKVFKRFTNITPKQYVIQNQFSGQKYKQASS